MYSNGPRRPTATGSQGFRRPTHTRSKSTALSLRKESARISQPRTRLSICFFLFGILICSLFNFVGVAAAVDLVGQAAPPGVVLFCYTFPSIYVRLFIPYMPTVLPDWLSPTFYIREYFPSWTHKVFGIDEGDEEGSDVEEDEDDDVLGGGTSAVDYPRRLAICAVSSFTGLQLLSWTQPIWLRLFGIVLVSLASNLGEMTFLQLSTLYPTNLALGSFSSGTGASGLLSALIYNAATSWLNISVSVVISCVGIVPFAILFIYFVILPPGSSFVGTYSNKKREASYSATPGEMSRLLSGKREKRLPLNISALPLLDKLRLVNGLMVSFMIPLFSTFFFIYLANQGLLADLIFPVPIPASYLFSKFFSRIFTQLRAFYPAYQFIYMSGAFLGRSSINIFRLPAPTIWMYFPLLLGILFFLALLWEALSMTRDGDAFGLFVTILIIVGGGIAEGLSYGNSYWRVSREDLPEQVDKQYSRLARREAEESDDYFTHKEVKGEQTADPEVTLREFLISSLAISDVFGILLASIAATALEPAVCRAQVEKGRFLCRQR